MLRHSIRSGPFANTVADAALLLNTIAGYDPRDNTSSNRAAEDFTALLDGGLKGKTIGVPKEAFGEGLDAGRRSLCARDLGGL